MNIVGCVIHLRRATSRLKPATDLQDQCGVPCGILDAVDGGQMDAAGIASVYQPALIKPHYPFQLGAGEVGCFLSHRNAWQKLLKTEADAVLILEDDMQITDGFQDAMALAQRIVVTMGYVQFQTRVGTGVILDTEGLAKLYRPAVTPLRTSGQLVSRQAAEHLLHLTQRFDRPVDTFLQMHWHTGIHAAVITPSGIKDIADSAGGSTITKSKSITEKLSREWHRMRYRRAVARLSSKDQIK